MIARPMLAAAALLVLESNAAEAAGKEWRIGAVRGDFVVKAADHVPPVFSARGYAQALVPQGYRLVEVESGSACAIEIALRPLSLIGDVLSFSLTYRRLPGECRSPLRNGGYHVIRALWLKTGRPARLEQIISPKVLTEELRAKPEIADLLGAEAVSTVTPAELFRHLDEATAMRCDRRLTLESLSAFYVGGTDGDATQLDIAFDQACGQLADDPAIETVTLALSGSAFKRGTATRILAAPEVRFRFESLQ